MTNIQITLLVGGIIIFVLISVVISYIVTSIKNKIRGTIRETVDKAMDQTNLPVAAKIKLKSIIRPSFVHPPKKPGNQG